MLMRWVVFLSFLMIFNVNVFQGEARAASSLIIKVLENPLTLYKKDGQPMGVAKGKSWEYFSAKAQAGQVMILEEANGLLKIQLSHAVSFWVDEIDVVVSRKSKFVPSTLALKNADAIKSTGFGVSALEDE